MTYEEHKHYLEGVRVRADERYEKPETRQRHERALARSWKTADRMLDVQGTEYVRAAREVAMSVEEAAEVDELLGRLQKLEDRADREGWRHSAQFGRAVKMYCRVLVDDDAGPASYEEGPERTDDY